MLNGFVSEDIIIGKLYVLLLRIDKFWELSGKLLSATQDSSNEVSFPSRRTPQMLPNVIYMLVVLFSLNLELTDKACIVDAFIADKKC